MSTPASEKGANASYQPFTKSEHIQQLNAIDRSITQLLKSAGLAIKALTASEPSSLEERKESIKDAVDAYLRTLQHVDVHLRRQIMALEEADIVPDKAKVKKAKATGNTAMPTFAAKPEPGKAVEEGGMTFDIGWLNSRSGQVSRDMEAELWEKARELLKENNHKGNGISAATEDSDKDLGG